MTLQVAPQRSNQPERSAGRVIAFCLVLHRARVAVLCITAKQVGSLSDRFNLSPEEKSPGQEYFLLPCLAAIVTDNVVAVSDCAALWCPDFPHASAARHARPSVSPL